MFKIWEGFRLYSLQLSSKLSKPAS
uniref:Uncharacterized protein n=1 Tax=Anguilla anguilla TaxID=7936 RepID=A0A0E9PBC7_ANGAN